MSTNLNDKDVARISNQLLKQLKNSQKYVEINKYCEHAQPSNELDTRKKIKKEIRESGYLVDIQNMVFDYMLKRKNGQVEREEKETILFLKKAQRSWEKCIVKSINNMCTELNLPLSRPRNTDDQEVLQKKFEEMTLGAEYNDAAYVKLRPVYSSTDFFEVLVSIKNANSSCNPNWGIIKVQLAVPDSLQIRKTYWELRDATTQLGLQDIMSTTLPTSFESLWEKVGEKVLTCRQCSVAKQFLKQGSPSGLRKQLWKLSLNLHIKDVDKLHYEQLKKSVFEHDLLVDYLIMEDVRLTTTNDDSFFVFEDVLYQILLVFSRDVSLLKHFQYSSANPHQPYVKGRLGTEEPSVSYPPCGIFPFHGFSMLAAPLCFVYEQPNELYFVFRELYTRFFYKLHCISSESEGILSICSLFESLLQTEDATLMKYMNDKGIPPLKVVFNWFVFAYSGYLAAEETLQLWDKILAYDSFHLLAVVAVVILMYRRENIMCITSVDEAEAVLADISTIKVIPLLIKFMNNKDIY